MGPALGRLARHDPFGHLYLHTIMMILVSVATTSFDILLVFSLPSCLHLRATPFSAEGVGTGAYSPYSADTSPDTDLHSGYCVHEEVSHHARTIVFTVVGCLVCLSGLRPVLPPQPAAPAHGRSHEPTDARQRGYEASRSCSWPFSVRAIEEDMLTPVTLRFS
jgi:hypothetical protein